MVLAAATHQLVGTPVERYEILHPIPRLNGATWRDIGLPAGVERVHAVGKYR